MFILLLDELERELKELKGNRDPFTIFGPWVRNVQVAIERDNSFRQKPVGPLGMNFFFHSNSKISNICKCYLSKDFIINYDLFIYNVNVKSLKYSY